MEEEGWLAADLDKQRWKREKEEWCGYNMGSEAWGVDNGVCYGYNEHFFAVVIFGKRK